MHAPRHNGFTLVELAVAITIIGLLVGSVVIGRDMIRAAQVQSVVSDSTKYIDAMNQFRDKYQAMPGDYSLATTMWGPAHVNPVTCQTTTGSGTATCDGNGDGRIGSNAALSTATQYERYRAWQHLVNAGLMSGSYSGVPGASGAADDVIGTNVPRSKLSGAGWSITSLLYTEVTAAPSQHYFPAQYMHVLLFGADATSSTVTSPPDWNYGVTASALKASEALKLDQKLDDGLPGSGKVMAPMFNSPFAAGCTTTADPLTARYVIIMAGPFDEAINCPLIFLTGI